MDEYYYDYGWLFEDNKKTAYRTGAKNLYYRVIKYYKDGRMENMTDTVSRDDAIERLKQIKLLDPTGQQNWVDDWEQEKQDKQCSMNDYLRAKGRL